MHMAELKPTRAGFAPLSAIAYFSQRFVTHPSARRRIGRMVGRLAGAAGVGPAEAGPQAESLRTLQEQGLLRLGRALSPGEVAETRAHFDGCTPEFRSKDGTVEEFSTVDVVKAPHLLAFAASPALLGLAAGYLGCRPTISCLGVRRSHPGPEDPHWGQAFHRDVDDWASVKLFVYLSDVEEGYGPHIFLERSHRTPGTILLKDRTAEEVEAIGRPTALLGPAGTAFLVDTFGLHRGEPPRRGTRLLFQVQYSVLPVGLYRYDVRVPARDLPAELARGLDRHACRLFVS